MGNTGVDRNYQIKTGYERCGRQKIRQLFVRVHDVGALAKRNPVLLRWVFLQADESRVEIQDGRQCSQRRGSVVIVGMDPTARPHKTDAKALVRSKPAFPLMAERFGNRR